MNDELSDKLKGKLGVERLNRKFFTFKDLAIALSSQFETLLHCSCLDFLFVCFNMGLSLHFNISTFFCGHVNVLS